MVRVPQAMYYLRAVEDGLDGIIEDHPVVLLVEVSNPRGICKCVIVAHRLGYAQSHTRTLSDDFSNK